MATADYDSTTIGDRGEAYMGFDYIGFLGETNVKMWTMDLSKTAFVLMHGLLYKWNALHRKERFNMTDEKLMTLTSIKSRSALRKAKKELQGAGLMTYYPSNKRFGTTYWIAKNHEVEQKESYVVTDKKATTEER